jgi:uncharacterized protein YegL
MSRRLSIHRSVFVSLTLVCIAGAWWGCSAAPADTTTEGGNPGSTSSGSGGTAGAGGTQGTGGIDVDPDAGPIDDGGACVSTSAEATRVPLDIVFLVDRSLSMSGAKWAGTKAALNTFCNDPASAKIGAGMSFFPNYNASPCIPEDYQVLDVPIAALPGNAFALTNSMPADAVGGSTPTWGALKGTLMVATAYQDAHSTHKVIVVVATDGGPNSCGLTTIEDIAELAKSARSYNGVLTYVIGVEGSDISLLNKIAVAGGTTAAYDITNDINLFSKKMEEIRGSALGCEFEIPPPPDGQDLDPDKVNFSYTPQGLGLPKVLLRALDLVDCTGDPGWYYDSNTSPTKIILCPASCATVQADTKAKVDVLFGCKSQLK